MSQRNGLPRIPEYYAGKNIFITGGTGFIGKVLVEKILRSCPDIECIYLLMRPKRGTSVEERLKTITDIPVSEFSNTDCNIFVINNNFSYSIN